jgi:hypothetical protein
MVDRSTITLMGWFVLAIGLGGTLGSPWLARLFAENLRLRPDRRDGSPRPTPAQRRLIERWVRAWIIFSGVMGTLVGALWIAGIGLT